MVRVLIHTILIFGVSIFATAVHANSSISINALIDVVSKEHNVESDILRTIVQIESSFNPWVFNVDREGFSFQSAEQAIKALSTIDHKPWMVKIKEPNEIRRVFFANTDDVSLFLSAAQRYYRTRNIELTIACKKHCTLKHAGAVMVRKLKVESTDIGLAQINYKWHGKQYRASIPWAKWFDPAFNLQYAAKHLSDLEKRYQTKAEVVANYHSKSIVHQRAYLARFNAVWPHDPLLLPVRDVHVANN